ncbi:MAG: diacylglycerol kinase family lipid kinase [Cyanobacteria bacterium REEB67]|nr:diacylglycerol kinase family lipid kinase [Cyanobacteria bacterium REEB67]
MQFASKRIAVIFNPKGGSARGALIEQLEAALTARGLALVRYTTTPAPCSARDLAAEAGRTGVDLVIACGGDGTVCQAAEGLIGSGVPLAVMPAGTGNLFARAFYARPDVPRLVDLIASGQPQPIDMMRLTYTDLEGLPHEQLYLVALGLGKMSDAISGASVEMKRRFGKLTYVVRMLAAAFNPDPVTYTFQTASGEKGGIDQENPPVTTRASLVFAINAVPPAMATLSRGCNASDGLLDLVALKATGFFSLLQLSSRFLLGRPDLSPHYLRARTKVLRINTDRPVCPNIDGDPGRLTQSMQISTLPQAVKVLVS